jgi:hypothetical protein
VTLGCAYHLLLFPQSADAKPLFDKIFNEISHLIGSQQKFLMQNFMLIYYLYLLLCHRYIRSAPPLELNRYNQILVKHQGDILKNYAQSKKSTVSNAELKFKALLVSHTEKLNLGPISEEASRVLEANKMNWLLLPTSKVRSMMERDESLKDFTTKCLLVPYSIDILSEDLAFEVNGPFHYIKDSKTNSFQMNGHTKLKKEFIEGIGLKYIEVPFWKLDDLLIKNSEYQISEIKNLIEKKTD